MTWQEMRQTGQSRSQCKFEQTFVRAVQTRGDDLVGIEPKLIGQGQRTNAGDFLGRTADQVLAQPLDDRRVDALFGQSVQQPFQPLATRGRQLRRLHKGIAGVSKARAGSDS